MVEMGEARRSEVRVTERFRCAQSCDVEVFSLCHRNTDTPRVLVSYARCGMAEFAPVKAFTEEGRCVATGTGDKVGKVSYKRHAREKAMYDSPESGLLRTYSKSPTMAHFTLRNRLSGRADIHRVTVTSMEPFQVESTTEFSIQVGPHRAFDVDHAEEHYVVVEEGEGSSARRSVRLFRQSQEQAVSTYCPPTAEYQPSDVCFYTLGGQHVLLVTDELNDAIHVVSVQGRAMRFLRHLCPGCPSLIQPTAITVDVRDRLWVACRGGAILMIEKTA
eukprot:TRINITY_DN55077_c0_g1_i1.p1 TRINITY_DN55077_c0_g1~~TRINITY_DN55077_c0_g1_i1.p1  ORF type:complete len:275 (-),score=28.99 TRINITY_DN55077_c0_g1_i1:69-893(-)